jgi:hypothetical protein
MKIKIALFLTQLPLALNCYSEEKIIEITVGKWDPYIVTENTKKPGALIEIVEGLILP